MKTECTGDIRKELSGSLLLHGVDEKAEEDTSGQQAFQETEVQDIKDNQGFLGPYGSDSLDLCNTKRLFFI
jgi:hypothetical protein